LEKKKYQKRPISMHFSTAQKIGFSQQQKNTIFLNFDKKLG
jgi:hypothetical protein